MGFFHTCTGLRGPPELDTLPAEAHTYSPLLRHVAEHRAPTTLPQKMDKEERDAAICYRTHAYSSKEAEFIHAELAKQVQAGHVSVFPLEEAIALQNLWLLPVAVTPQVVRRQRIIFDFTWSGINNISERLPPMEAMRFGGALLRILKQVLTANPCLGPVYLSKVDLSDAYTIFWMSMEDVPSVAFLIPKKNPSDTRLVVLHFSLPMGYIDSATDFFMSRELLADLANKAINSREKAVNRPLELADEAREAGNAGAPETQTNASWEHLPPNQRAAAEANVDVYL